ncbi:uncharacterized protein UV8b_07106 [Ustilaginoidea virens]|uniref:Uncharacterized protein n=1 Tax=Ustilaginoidea virens TaxID=1159556 RepID=A0A8E5HWF0_USTVR|nr:uncharacterized protein UV8b_07106 [Ustilaginoidea virens]QUC22865.1 hypothetical protein UV8b_07106 [Ustilaginoidea virens]
MLENHITALYYSNHLSSINGNALNLLPHHSCLPPSSQDVIIRHSLAADYYLDHLLRSTRRLLSLGIFPYLYP